MLGIFQCFEQGWYEQNENWPTLITTTTQSTCEERPQPQPQFDLITNPNHNINTIFLQLDTTSTTPTQFFESHTTQPQHIFRGDSISRSYVLTSSFAYLLSNIFF